MLQVRIDAAALLHDVVEGWFPLRNIKGKTMRGGGEIKLRVRLIGIPDNPVYARGINAQDPNSAAVEDAFFPERSGNQVIMYQVLQLVHKMLNSLSGLAAITFSFYVAQSILMHQAFSHASWMCESHTHLWYNANSMLALYSVVCVTLLCSTPCDC